MGMVGQLYVRPRQNRLTAPTTWAPPCSAANKRAARGPEARWPVLRDILCTGQTPLRGAAPAPVTGADRHELAARNYAYNDGDGSTRYDVEYPIQMMGFDPNFHYVGMTFNPEAFADMKDKYFLLNGRSYPDTVNPSSHLARWPPTASRGPAQPLRRALITHRQVDAGRRARCCACPTSASPST